MLGPVLGIVAAVGVIYFFLFRNPRVDPDKPFPKKWKRILEDHVDFYNDLTQPEKHRFETAIRQFLADVKVTGVKTRVKTLDRLLVAASAVIPMFGFPDWRYRNINEVLLYKGRFNYDLDTEAKKRNVLGMVGNGSMQRMMVLSKEALRRGYKNKTSKKNVGIHEFVHLVDKADGAVDGVPEVIIPDEFTEPWLQLMHREIQAIENDESDINPYATTSEAEFLSVVSEYLFSRPQLFEKKHPKLYALMEKMYRQELAA